MNKHLHELLILQELDVGGSTDPGVKILVFDFEVDVKSE